MYVVRLLLQQRKIYVKRVTKAPEYQNLSLPTIRNSVENADVLNTLTSKNLLDEIINDYAFIDYENESCKVISQA